MLSLGSASLNPGTRMNPRLIAAVGVLAALTYISSFLLLAIPNVTLSILLVFYSGFYLGNRGGILVGVIGSLLISLLNPYGVVQLPILIAQVFSYATIGLAGGLLAPLLTRKSHLPYLIWLGLLGVVTAIIYQLPVSIIDALIFRPFWARLAASAAFSVVTIVGNLLFFVILFPILAKLKKVNIIRTE